MKRCSKCKIEKESSEFAKDNGKKDKLRSICKQCDGERYKQNEEKMKANSKIYYQNNYKNNPEKRKSKSLKYNYNMTWEIYNQMLIKQNNKCKICNNEFKNARDTHIDHCHTSLKVRGILCNNCNTAIGLFKEDVNNLKNAITYLELWHNS
jgi:hypothetical protein